MALFAIVARGTIVLFAIVVLALAVPPLYVGCMLASRGSTMFLATPLPDYLPGACIGASLLLLSKFVVTVRGACSPDRKLSLALAMIVTLILMTLSACASAMCFEVQRSIVDPNAHNVFVGQFFSAVRHRFERMFEQCEPAAYATDRVNEACEQLAPPEMQGCALNPPGRAGVYCTSGPGLEPFTLDTTLRFARQRLREVALHIARLYLHTTLCRQPTCGGSPCAPWHLWPHLPRPRSLPVLGASARSQCSGSSLQGR